MILRHRFLTFVLINLAAALLATKAFSKPTLAGNWTMPPEKSDFVRMPISEKYVQVIEEKGAHVKHDFQCDGIKLSDKWSFGDDGETLTSNRDVQQRILLNKKW